MKKLLFFLPVLALLAGCKPSEFAYEYTHASTRVLLDGTNSLANALFAGADESLINKLAPDGHTPVACNVLLVQVPSTPFASHRNILIDTGYGGNLQAELKAAGLSPEDITDILLTHSHFDHVGGLLASDGATRVFQNAHLHITAAELDFWRASNPEQAAACEKAYKIVFITPDEKTHVAISAIVAIDAAGHTPGHVVFLINRKILFAGDLLHSDLMQFAHPKICADFDNDKEAAVAMRRKILTRAAEENWDFIASHVPKSGRIEKDGDGFRLVVDE